jgi:hypothetical protein
MKDQATAKLLLRLREETQAEFIEVLENHEIAMKLASYDGPTRDVALGMVHSLCFLLSEEPELAAKVLEFNEIFERLAANPPEGFYDGWKPR